MQLGGGPPLDVPPWHDAAWTLVGADAAVLDTIDTQRVITILRREIFHLDVPGVAFVDLDGARVGFRIKKGIIGAGDAAVLVQGAGPERPRTSSRERQSTTAYSQELAPR